MVTGNDSPLTVNSPLLRLTEETVTVAPEATSCAVFCELFPTTTLPKFKLVGFTANVPVGFPMPANGIFSVEFDALDVMARFPLSLPAEGGVNTTLNVMLWPTLRVSGGTIPLTLNPAPVALAREIVTSEPPVLLIVSDNDLLFPTCTLPKLMLVCVGVKVPGWTAEPASGMFSVPLEALLAMTTLPLTFPADGGVNTTLNVVLCPLASVTGRLRPFMLKPVPVVAV